MRLAWPVQITGSGAYMPERVVTNDELARTVDTSNEWIVQRTGIRERRWAAPGQGTLALATNASQGALANAGLTPKDIDLIVCATISPEHMLPSTAALLQAALGCRWIPAYDLSAACSGFVYGMMAASQYIVTGVAETVLLIGAETLSTITDPLDRATCILFGDGAGAAVLRRSTDTGRGIIAARWGADGERGKLIYIPAGGSRHPATRQTVDERLHFMRMQGREVYKFAVTQMQQIIEQTCADAGVSVGDLKLLIPHQSNLRIIESACARAGVPLERVWINIDLYGNTSSASVAVALHEARTAGRWQAGDLVMLVAFGAGLTWASVLMRM